MPILQRETALYPEYLLDGEPNGEGETRRWWAMHTLPRQEKSLARDLLARDIPFYLPLHACRRRCRGRVMTTHRPLFPSYVFVFGDDHQRVAALKTKRVVRSLAVADQDKLRRDLCRVRRLLDSGLPVLPEECLEPGVTVEIRSGPLAGLVGTLVRKRSGDMFVVYVDFIQKGASVLVEGVDLRAIPE